LHSFNVKTQICVPGPQCVNTEITGKEETEKIERNGHVRMKAQHNGPQRYMKLREELQVTETNKRGEKFYSNISHLKCNVSIL